ncbi:phosphoenolpyruvate--protein phosphotransferase [Salinactinospora qingdaonensis]|uniref:Phosphoenolpyruvate-protein phosphotransferase n=2 Tax=Salinactinospora qingdaonensis TaxID=702744 RepID=A0ABP7FJX4_9ACTN
MPEILAGIGVSSGVGHGPALRLTRAVPEPSESERHDGDAEAHRLQAVTALEETARELAELAERSDGEAQEVLNAQALMARDPALADDVKQRIGTGTTAARAVFEAFTRYRDLPTVADGYLAGRGADVDDVRERVVARLLGVAVPGIPESASRFVLVAHDLTPADTALLTPNQVLAFVIAGGEPTGHAAILARSLGLPAVVACEGCEEIPEGTDLLVDGATGEVVLEPTAETVEANSSPTSARPAVMDESTGPGRTADGHPVPLMANISNPTDLPAALENGAEGIGLYRTESLFLDRISPPDHDEQVAAYRVVMEAFPTSQIVVRPLDLGADNAPDYLQAAVEPNPALGERGLRMMRRVPNLLAGQLAALAEADRSSEAELSIVGPMVTDVDDAAWFAAATAEAGIQRTGALIEVPAAALRAHRIAESVGFFSIGTNDLTQYVCAADRNIAGLSRFQDPWQPAVIDLVAVTTQAARETQLPCGVCGTAVADPLMACVLVGLGATSLSMDASALPLVRTALSRATLEHCRAAARAARAAPHAAEAKRAAREALPGVAELGL